MDVDSSAESVWIEFYRQIGPFLLTRCHSRVIENPETQEGHFRTLTFEGRRVKLFIKNVIFAFKMLRTSIGILLKCKNNYLQDMK